MTHAAGSTDLPRYADNVRSVDDSTDKVAAAIPGWRWPHFAVLVLGLILLIAPLAGGMFYPAAQAGQMIAQFEPYLQPDRLDQFARQLNTVEAARVNTVEVNRRLGIDARKYPSLANFQQQYPDIHRDMSAMLGDISAGRGDYQNLRSLQPIDMIPFIPAGFGVLLIGFGAWGIRQSYRDGGRRTVVAPVGALAVSLALIIIPIIAGLASNAHSAGPLLNRFATVLTEQKVRDAQSDFVVLVGAVGELDSRYLKAVKDRGVDVSASEQLVREWQPLSSDFAGLIGTMNDNLKNFRGVRQLNDLTIPIGFGAFAGLPWILIGSGVVGVGLAAAGGIRRRKTA